MANLFKLFLKSIGLTKDTVQDVIDEIDREIIRLSIYILPHLTSTREISKTLEEIQKLKDRKADLKRRYKKANESKTVKVVQDVLPVEKVKQAKSRVQKSLYNVKYELHYPDGGREIKTETFETSSNPLYEFKPWKENELQRIKPGTKVNVLEIKDVFKMQKNGEKHEVTGKIIRVGDKWEGQILLDGKVIAISANVPEKELIQLWLDKNLPEYKRYFKKTQIQKEMSLSEAEARLGNRATWELEAMKRALSTFRILNTPEQEKDLEAVKVLLRERKKKKMDKSQIVKETEHAKVGDMITFTVSTTDGRQSGKAKVKAVNPDGSVYVNFRGYDNFKVNRDEYRVLESQIQKISQEDVNIVEEAVRTAIRRGNKSEGDIFDEARRILRPRWEDSEDSLDNAIWTTIYRIYRKSQVQKRGNRKDFNYRGWNVTLYEPGGMDMYWTWSAVGPQGSLGDSEGGDLGDLQNAVSQIKQWIDEAIRTEQVPRDLRGAPGNRIGKSQIQKVSEETLRWEMKAKRLVEELQRKADRGEFGENFGQREIREFEDKMEREAHPILTYSEKANIMRMLYDKVGDIVPKRKSQTEKSGRYRYGVNLVYDTDQGRKEFEMVIWADSDLEAQHKAIEMFEQNNPHARNVRIDTLVNETRKSRIEKSSKYAKDLIVGDDIIVNGVVKTIENIENVNDVLKISLDDGTYITVNPSNIITLGKTQKMGIEGAGKVPNSLLSRQDLEGDTLENSETYKSASDYERGYDEGVKDPRKAQQKIIQLKEERLKGRKFTEADKDYIDGLESGIRVSRPEAYKSLRIKKAISKLDAFIDDHGSFKVYQRSDGSYVAKCTFAPGIQFEDRDYLKVETIAIQKCPQRTNKQQKAEYSGSYNGYRIDVYKEDDGTFVSAVDNRIEPDTKARDIKTSFKYATSIIEQHFSKQEKMFDVERRSDGMWYVVDYTLGRKNIINAFRTKQEAENLANELNQKMERYNKTLKTIDSFIKKYG
jgi:preprotein translocase subunit YajC